MALALAYGRNFRIIAIGPTSSQSNDRCDFWNPTSQGTSKFTVQVTDSLSLSDTQNLSITIAAAPVPPNITTPSLLGGTVGTAYSQTLQRTGGTAPFTWIFTGTLPTGLSLTPSTGVISGIPSATGTFNFTPQVTDSLSLTDTTPPALSIVISNSAPNITTLILPDGTVGTAYNQTLRLPEGQERSCGARSLITPIQSFPQPCGCHFGNSYRNRHSQFHRASH